MATDQLKRTELAKPRQWRIKVKSDDQDIRIRYEEPFAGNAIEARKRAFELWSRTSYVVNGKLNRDVYTSLEVWDPVKFEYRMVKEKRGRLPRKALAPK